MIRREAMAKASTRIRGPVAVALTVALLASAVPAAAAQENGMSTAEFEAALSDMQDAVDRAADLYAAGDREGALAEAESVSARFATNGTGASPLELKIKSVSAVHIGDKVKAYASRLVTAIEAERSAEDVRAIAEELAPSLNRLVLIAQGDTVPASQRILKTADAVDGAVAEVLEQVEAAVAFHRDGDLAAGKEAAEEAFFTFEVNGLGGDTESVDAALEDETENLIRNFDKATMETNPGLSQLIEAGANVSEVEAQAARIETALGEVSDLLKATLPPLSLGDANGDGKVSIIDALLVAQAALGIRGKTANMDANQDGSVTIIDALLVAQAALGIRNL